MLKAWLPIPSLSKTIILFFVMSAIFLGIGIPMLILSNNIVEVTVGYDSACSENAINCTLTFTIPQTMNSPVSVFYELNNYYQNHRLYASSISYKQLKGDTLSLSEVNYPLPRHKRYASRSLRMLISKCQCPSMAVL